MPRPNKNWLANLAREMQRPANDVIRELLATYSTQGAADIINVSHHTLRRHCERVGIPLQKYKQSPGRKKVESVAINRRSRLLEVDGVCMTVAEWSRKTGVPSSTIRMRVDRFGWSPDRAVSLEVGLPYKRKGCIK
jgi:transposase